jgi:SAM-dependent methyltransferase
VTVGEGGSARPDVEGFFDETAWAYDRSYSDPGAGGRVLRSRAAAVLELLGEEPGDVLDAGMGAGVLCAELDRRGWVVSGVDISSAMVDGAIARLPHLSDRLRRASITELPYDDGSFDAVVATGVLEYVPDDLPLAVGELARVLRRGGVAVVSYPNYRAPVTIWRGRVLYPLVRAAKRMVHTGMPPPPRVPQGRLSRLRQCLDRAGLRVEELRPAGSRPLPAGLAERLDASRSRLAFQLAVQVVVRARKPVS